MSFLSELLSASRRRRRLRRARAELARIVSDNTVEIDDGDLLRVQLHVKGSGNVIRIGRLRPGRGRLDISLFAWNCTVEIGEGLYVGGRLEIGIGQDNPNFGCVSGSCVRLGANVGVESCLVAVFTSNSSVAIGRDCMIGHDVTVFHGDAHPVYDRATGEIVNRVGQLTVGDHVWLGSRSTVLKNSAIADGCIVGWGSVVAGRFTEPNVALAGNPARPVGRPDRRLEWRTSDPAYIANGGGI